ncbi:MAG: S1 RNA-binding domain-containing protein [Planctomycetaceae bacterium]|nr:S1 RNA-binding domain-containing protein [Planctomycetaceae bacterium]
MSDDQNSPEIQSTSESPEKPKKRLIGSQRDPDAYRPKPVIAVEGATPAPEKSAPAEVKTATYPPEGESKIIEPAPQPLPTLPKEVQEKLDGDEPVQLSEDGEKALKKIPVAHTSGRAIPPTRFGKLSDDLEEEFNAIVGNTDLAELVIQTKSIADQDILEKDAKVKAKVISIHGENVFVDVGAREQGIIPLKIFPEETVLKIGDEIDVIILRLNEGLYEVTIPLAAADVHDWSQVQTGMVVAAHITKVNNGGLECEVNRLRAFMPFSQIDIGFVEKPESYVGQTLKCIVEEVNPERRNLVVSRRALLHQEREASKEQVLASLEEGQIREGLIRKIIDAGVFVDLGGVDGFIHISKLAWGRVKHPSEVVQEGTRIKVRIEKIDSETGRISLVYRDDATNPWANIGENFSVKTQVRGKVTRITDFGAFVELAPGVEGLVHISELSHKRVNAVRDVLKEGDWTDVFIVSVDPETKRIALSIRQLTPKPETETEEKPAEEGQPETAAPEKQQRMRSDKLKGGTTGGNSGNRFGLKW